MSNLDLATLKFKVETGELQLAITKLKEVADIAGKLSKKTDELSKSNENLLKAERLAAEASLAQAQAQLKMLDVAIRVEKLNGAQIDSAKKKADLSKKEAEAALSLAAAEEKNASAKLKSAKADDLAARASESSTKAKTQQVTAGNSLSAMIDRLASKTQFVVEGNSRGESSYLALAKQMGATGDQIKKITELFEIQRRVIGGDPFDKSASASAKLGRELSILQQYMQNVKDGTGLTKSQMQDLAREMERLTQLAKGQNLSSKETSSLLKQERDAYIEKAKAINELNNTTQESIKKAKAEAAAKLELANAQDRIRKFEDKVQFRKESDPSITKGIITQMANYREMLLKVGLAEKDVEIRTRAMGAELINIEASRSGSTFFKGLAASIGAAAAAFVGFNGITAAVQKYAENVDILDNLKARMDAVSQGTAKFSRDFSQLVNISNQTGASLESVGTVFTRLLPAMENYGKGSKDAIKITSNLAAILKVSGVTASEASSSLLQISQAFNKGKLDGDEFRSVAENMPEVLRLLESALNKSRGELYKMSEQGQITGKLLSDVLGKDIDSLNSKLAQMPVTLSQAQNYLSNSFILLSGAIEKQTGVASVAKDALVTLGQAMTGLSKDQGLLQLVTGLVAGFTSMLVVTALAGGITLLAGAFKQLAFAAGLINAAGKGSIFGILVTLAGIGVGMYVSLQKPVDEVKKMKDNLQEVSTELERIKKTTESGKVYIGRNQSRDLTPQEKTANENLIRQKTAEQSALKTAIAAREAKDLNEKTMTALGEFRNKLSPEETLKLSSFDSLLSNASRDPANQRAELQSQIDSAKEGLRIRKEELALKYNSSPDVLKQQTDKLNRDVDASIKVVEAKIKSLDKKENGPVKEKRTEAIKFEAESELREIEKRNTRELDLARRNSSIQLDILDNRFSSGQIKADEYYSSYFAAAANAYNDEIVLISNGESEYANKKNQLLLSYAASLEKFKQDNIGVKDYQDKVNDATQQYVTKVKQLNDQFVTFSEKTDAAKKIAFDNYIKRISDSTRELSRDLKSLNIEYSKFFESEKNLVKQNKEEFDFKQSLRGQSAEQVAAMTAEYETRKRIQMQINKFAFEQTRLEAQLAQIKIAVNKARAGQDEKALEVAEQELEIVQKQYAELEANRDKAQKLLNTAPIKAATEAVNQFRVEQFANFVQGINDSIFIGLTQGAKKGARSIRELIMQELRKPIDIVIKAIISDITGQTTGQTTNSIGKLFDMFSGGSSSSNSMFSSISKLAGNFVDVGNILTKVGSYLGIGGASVGASGGAGLISSGTTATSASGISLGAATGATGSGFALGTGGATGSGLVLGSSTAATSVNGAIAAANGAGTVAAGGAGAAGLASSVAAVAGPIALAYAAYKIGGMIYDMGYNKNNTEDYGVFGKGRNAFVGPAGPVNAIHDGLKAIGINDKLAGMLSGSTMFSALFGRQKKKYTGFGLQGDFNGDGFSGMQFRDWKQRGGLFRKNRSGTEYSALDSEFTNFLSEAFVSVKLSAKQAADQLGLSSDSIKAYSKSIKLYLSGDAKDNNKKIEEMFKGMSDEIATRLIPNISEFALENERTSDTLLRLANNLTGVNELLGLTNVKVFKLSVANSSLATTLLDSFGGMDKAKEAISKYYDLFFSSEEKRNNLILGLTVSFAKLGYVLPQTKTEFRKLVESLDVTTESGRNAYTALINLAPTFDQVTASTEKLKEGAIKIKETIKGITTSQLTPENNLKQLLGDFDSLLLKATTATGEEKVKLVEQINSALEPIVESAKNVYASTPDFFKLQSDVFNKANIFADALSRSNVSTYEDKTLTQFADMNGSLALIATYGELSLQQLKQLLVVQQSSVVDYAKVASLNEQGMSGNLDATALEGLRNQIIQLGGVPMFANGAMFSNGIVSKPTAFNMGVMGEKTPEAIMPLARASDGSLGVRSSSTTIDMSPLSMQLQSANRNLEALVRLQQSSNMKMIERLSAIEEKLDGLDSAARLAASA
jgi:tape measure domain-containing protein